MRTLALSVVYASAAVALAPVALADVRNRQLQPRTSQGRYDFHTWAVGDLAMQVHAGASLKSPEGCAHVSAIAMPVAKAFGYEGDALLANGRYTLTVDVPDGLRCGDVYYGPTIPTHDVYSWDATTLAGVLDSSFATGCDGAPAGTYTYPFTLSRM